MTLTKARILKAGDAALVAGVVAYDARASGGPAGLDRAPHAASSPHDGPRVAKRVPKDVVDAHHEAARILEKARETAETLVAEARAKGEAIAEATIRAAREETVARVLAELVAMRVSEEQRAERELDRTIEIAKLLAERVLGDAIELEPNRIAALAQGALRETRGARRIRIEAAREDIPALEAMLAAASDTVTTLEPSAELGRGSLIVHTDLGRIEAQLAPQLTRLADALRETLQASSPR